MLLPCCARAGQDLGRPPLEREVSLRAVVWARSWGGVRGGVARGRGMALGAAGGWRWVPGPACGGAAGCAVYDRARLGAAVRAPGPGAGNRVRGAGGGAGRGGGQAGGGRWPVRAGRDRRGVRRGGGPAGMARGGGVAVRVLGERREADRGQRNLALPYGRQTAFH